jgi:lipid-binding SYLF domain-containing protein
MTKALPITTVALAVLALSLPGVNVSADEPQSWKSLERQSKRMKIDEEAQHSLNAILHEDQKAQGLFDMAYGWAAFDNLKIAIGFSGGGGNGVAVNKQSGERTYMKMGTAGVGLGLGGKKYQVVFFFQDEQTFSNFVEKGWKADTSAAAVAGGSGAGVAAGFTNGMAVYQITDKGLMASADISGTKYWKNKKLNRK